MRLHELSTATVGVLPSSLRVVAFRGREALSTSFSYEILARVPREDVAELDLATVLDQPATLRVRDDDGVHADVHGVIWACEIVHADALVHLRVELAPRMRRLQLMRTSRVFCDTTLGEIAKTVLAEADLSGAAVSPDPALDALSEEHVCQYEESHWDFVARWLERVGTTFYFDHEEDTETVVLLSSPSKHPDASIGRLKYDPKSGDDATVGRSAFDARFTRVGRLASVRLRDEDYLNPSLDVAGEAAGDLAGHGEWVHHGRRFFSPGAGGDLAQVIAEGHLARSKAIEIFARSAPLHVGFAFELEGHPDVERNGKLVATRLDVVGWNVGWTAELELLFPLRDALGARAPWGGPTDLANGLVSRIGAVPRGTPWRAPQSTPWPRIFGVETAVIDGEDAPYASLDDAGRYQIRFHFDARAGEAGRHSTLVRMSQPHAGNPEGWHFPLRPTTEVLVAFEDGDVDRPVIVGAVPDGAHPSLVTSANHTKNVFHTGGDNRLEIEDQAGSEWLHWLTPTETTYIHLGAHFGSDQHNIVKHTDADLLFRIGANQDITVGGELREWVSGPVDEDYKTTLITIILGPQTTTVSGAVVEDYDQLQLTIVASDTTETYQAGQKSTVTGTKIELYSSGQATDVQGGVTETYTGPHVKAVTADVIQEYSSGLSRTVTGPVLQTFGSAVTLDWGATDQTYKSLLWMVPVDVHMTAPKLDMFHLSKTSMTLKCDDIDWTKNENEPTATSLAIGKIEYQARHVAMVLFKADATGFSIGYQAGPSQEYGILGLELVGLFIKTAGGPQTET